MPAPQSHAQSRFLQDLFKDLERLFYTKHHDKVEDDFVAWFGGFLNRHIAHAEPRWYTTRQQLLDDILALSAAKARRLIAAMRDSRDAADNKAGRDQVRTPKNLITAIWTAASEHGQDKDAVAEIVCAVTKGEATSTTQLRRHEAVEVLRRVGGTTTVFEMQRAPGGKITTRPKEKTIV